MTYTVNEKALKRQFGKIIRAGRKKKKLTQERLSELTGITQAYLRDIEHGNSTVTWIIWLRLCTVLDLDIPKFQEEYFSPQFDA